MDRFETRLAAAEPEFRELVHRIPLQDTPPLPPEWLRCEMLERDEVLRRIDLAPGATVVEVGSGAHAIATVPIAARVGSTGRVVAVERSRWAQFRTVVSASGLGGRIRPLAADARRLPMLEDSANAAVCIHGIRSLGGEGDTVRVVREMLRVSPVAILAESLPLARTSAQEAHLAMYNLREDVFEATMGKRDDLPYATLERLVSWVQEAGGAIETTEVLEVDLPHFLARFPRSMVEGIPAADRREELLRRWDDAERMREQFGEDHPPIGIVSARRP